MSSSQPRRAHAASAAAGQDRSLLQLLDPNDMLPGHTTADLYSLRHFTLRGGLPDSPSWLRAQAWKVLLGYLPPEKKEWSSTLAKRRREYYQFVGDLSPDADPLAHPVPVSQITNNDRLLDQIYKDLVRSRNNGFAFYQAPPRPSASCPLTPLPPIDAQPGPSAAVPVQRLAARDNLLHRLAAISHEYAQQLSIERVASTSTSSASRHPPQILHVQSSSHAAKVLSPLLPRGPSGIIEDPIKSPPILLSPPSPGGMSRESSQHSFASANEALEDAASSHGHGGPQSMNKPQGATGTNSMPESSADHAGIPTQRNWHSLLRNLYLFAVLNPSIGYVQGMNEVLFTLLYVFGSARYPPTVSAGLTPSSSQHDIAPDADGAAVRAWDNEADLADLTTHAEADAFWCFSALIGEMRELYDFERIEQQSRGVASAERQPSHSGMAGALRRFSLRIKWLDPPLWRTLQSASLDPRLPYYSLRWLACLLSTELSLPSVLRIWDALLAEQESAGVSGSAKIEFLIDVCASMMLHIKHRLPRNNDDMDLETEGFSYGMRVLQDYPDDDISPVVEEATLIRQRRLAADLTGDGPPDASDDDEEEETNSRIAAVKARAAQAWREWTGPRQDLAPPALPAKEPADATPPATKGGWLVSRARPRTSQATNEDGDLSIASSTDGAASDTSMSSKSTFSGFLAKYAEAVQSSDAAANLSKASTNFTAKAMARFGDRGSRESTPETSASPHQMYGSLGRGLPSSPTGSMFGGQDSRFASLGSVGAGFFTRSRRNASESQSPSVGWGSPHTPDITRWSRDTMPDFPLPNVADSPAGRMEYVDTFGKRISMAPNGRGGTSPSNSVAGDVSRERRGSENASSFPLPSMRAAARMGILPSRFREESASPSQRSAGPKPLLLSQSARPPREGSNSPRSLVADEPSRKVSSGPMGHSMSRGNSHQDGSVTGSFSGRSSRSVSAADSRRSSMADFADFSMPGLSEAGAVPPLPSLTGQSSASMLPGRSMPANGASSDGSRILPGTATPLQGLASKEGTVSAGAFTRATTKATESERERPEFGHVSSSSDVPLVQTTSSSISRPRTTNRQRTSSSTVDSRTASFSESTTGNHFSNRSSQTTNVVDGLAEQGVSNIGFVNGEVGGAVMSEEPASVHDLPGHSKVELTNGGSRSDTPSSERPDTSSADAAYASTHDQTDPVTRPEPVRKYTLTDDPLPAPTEAKIVRSKRLVKGRQNSSSSASSRRSLAGLRRSSRNSVEPAPPSPQLALPEVVEDVYGGIVDGELEGDAPSGVEGQGYAGMEEDDGRRPQAEKLDMRSLRIGEPADGTSPVGRPSTDRSNFF